MIVREFLWWMQQAPADLRAEATRDLVESYLWGELSPADSDAAIAAMISLLDDRSPLVRLALAQSLAHHEKAPATVIAGLARDNAEIACVVIEHSPVLTEGELVDIAEISHHSLHEAMCARVNLPINVAIALAEAGESEIAISLLDRPEFTNVTEITTIILKRFGDDASVREKINLRNDLTPSQRLILVNKTAENLSNFISNTGWMRPERAIRLVRDCTDRAILSSIKNVANDDFFILIDDLQRTEKLTPSLLLRSVLSGQKAFFEASLSLICGLNLQRINGLLKDKSGRAINALLTKAGIPESLIPPFEIAFNLPQAYTRITNVGLQLHMVEAVLNEYQSMGSYCDSAVLSLLKQFHVESSREEARHFTSDLINQQSMSPAFDMASGAVLGWTEDPEVVEAREAEEAAIRLAAYNEERIDVLELFRRELAAKEAIFKVETPQVTTIQSIKPQIHYSKAA